MEAATEALHRLFGYATFRAGQADAVASVLAGRDTLVVLPTGGGKSLCFQVPALLLPHLTVVISPLISLMKDQVDALTARGLPATFINSTLTGGEISDRLARVERGEIKLLYVAPERFDSGRAAERLRATGVSLLAVDEAHCISEWGHDFRPSYLRVRDVRQQLGAPPTVALTATATPEVRRDIMRQLALSNPKTVITGFDRRNLHYHVVRTRTEADKDTALVAALREHPGLAVVYASTRRSVERITGMLARQRIAVVAYHAGLDDAQRHEVQNAFMREDVRVIVATNAFGMGIDKPNIRLVVHHAMPGTLEAYYQEAGRAGRDGQLSQCVLLHAFQDRFTHEYFVTSAFPERDQVERVYAVVQRAAASNGIASLTAAGIAAATHGQVKEREAESALRILTHAGALTQEPASSSRIWVRLLATPERIKRELAADAAAERDLLRALWRSAGVRLHEGALVNPDGLPPGFAGAPGVTAMLDWLQARQFVAWERTGGGLRPTQSARPLSAFSMDWEALRRRRQADLSKLDAMQHYAYARGCRRGFVLRYFGDPAARPSCDGCDNCLGTHRESATPARNAARAARPARSAPDVAAAAPVLGDELSPADATLVASLRGLRGTIARTEQLPAYCVFKDRTLTEMAVRRPCSLEALAALSGVGPAKLEKYGERFLALIRGATDIEAA